MTFVGIIREVSEAATNISYKIDDMTGDFISVRKWLDDEVSSCLIFYVFLWLVSGVFKRLPDAPLMLNIFHGFYPLAFAVLEDNVKGFDFWFSKRGFLDKTCLDRFSKGVHWEISLLYRADSSQKWLCWFYTFLKPWKNKI